MLCVNELESRNSPCGHYVHGVTLDSDLFLHQIVRIFAEKPIFLVFFKLPVSESDTPCLYLIRDIWNLITL